MDTFTYLAWRRPQTRAWLYPFFRVHADPIFFMGNQKSGTTAISSLLAYAADLRATTWAPGLDFAVLKALHKGRLSLQKAIQRYARIEFARPVIKECNLTFVYEQVRVLYPQARQVFVVRDPRDNLRSILDRLDLPGQVATVSLPDPLRAHWGHVLDNTWMGAPAGNPVCSLAWRWARALAVYRQYPGEFIRIRYEDFLANPEDAIAQLCVALNVPQKRQISNWKMHPFQPPGRNRGCPWPDFFGADPLAHIEDICAEGMAEMGYLPSKNYLPA